ncbi:efflux RND transporter periplasmic adaptor subunit [Pararobbsia alpina]|uniref:Toluene efflux pump periplasmic linker protein TtgA n=1 Tax=Pararobbsia alpina TaxID=621374 RepID=A0A6S7B5W1_9BURK|nr:efflux RND transporter periplasmic adaptor subunit [Pararobbsia alpina]CAB3780437.1 Toluene efflux pump periplasmic linker protein TtgA [Pararobbsia alpina]
MHVDRVPARFIGITGTAAAILAVFALSACGKKEAPPPPPPPEVGIVTVQPQPVEVIADLPGRTSAYLVAQVRARVDGIVLRRDFVEGAKVKAGQRLYQIDPAPYRAQLDSAKASLAKAQANLASQTAQAQRFKVLVEQNAVSRQDNDNAVASQAQAAADVATGKAAVQTASINLGYTDVVAPISGTIGISQVTPGAYVQASAATLMSTIQQLDPIYVDVVESTTDLLKLRRAVANGQIQAADSHSVKVTLTLEDGSTFAQPGRLEFSDVTVDQTTGTVTLRALFPNPQQILLPGMFVHAKLAQGINAKAMLVPQVGITHTPKGDPTALIVNADNKVEVRQLKTSGTRGSDWIVEGGLQPGDKVIVQGVLKAPPGATVKPVPANLPPPATTGEEAGVSGDVGVSGSVASSGTAAAGGAGGNAAANSAGTSGGGSAAQGGNASSAHAQ